MGNFFITETYLKNNVPVTNNVDMNDILFNVRVASDFNIRPILGTYFYNYMLDGYNNQTLNSDELELLDYIQIVVAWRAVAESVITLSYQLKNKGVQTQSGEWSLNGDKSEIMFLVHHYNDKASGYERTLSNYLTETKILFPQFMSDLNKDSVIKKCDGGDFSNKNMWFI